MTTEREVVIDSKYGARKQFRRFHRREQRWAILVCHRRAGKTVATLNDLIIRALQCPLPRPRYAFVFPQRNQAKDATWSELKNYTEGMWGSPPYENELRVEPLNGATIRLYGADNPDALRGAYFDGVVLEIRATRAQRNGPKDTRGDRGGYQCSGNGYEQLGRLHS
jgi:phage terminase large subunit